MAAPQTEKYSAWFDASILASITKNAETQKVSSWVDQTGGNPAVMADVDVQPVYVTTRGGGVHFRRNNDSGTYGDTLKPNASARYLFAVLAIHNHVANGGVMGRGAPWSFGQPAIRLWSGHTYKCIGNGLSSQDWQAPDGRTWINDSISNSPETAVFIDGKLHIVAAEEGHDAPNIFNCIGDYGYSGDIGNRGTDMTIHEIIAVADPLTDEEIGSINRYLMGRWMASTPIAVLKSGGL